jgi:hypothetical protein
MKKRKPTLKRLGEYAEVCFMQQCLARDISVTHPYGDSDPFDNITVYAGKKSLVQVRAAFSRYKRYDRYSVSGRFMGRRYFTADDIDFLAVFIVPHDAWYIIPVREILRCQSLQMIPHRRARSSRWEKYREAWGLLM